MTGTEQRVLRGPCAHPWCRNAESSSGGWKLIPEGNTKETRTDTTCLSIKKDNCRIYFSLPPLQLASRKRVALEMRSGSPDVAVGLALREEPLPRGGISKITEIWGVRCVHAHLPSSLQMLTLPYARVQALQRLCDGPRGPRQQAGREADRVLRAWPLSTI